MRILLTGATGYIGGRLVPRLIEAGHEVRCLARTPQNLVLRPWWDQVEIVAGDAMDTASIKEAAAGCDAAYYLIHSVDTGKGFEDRDRAAANNFREAAASAGLERIVYLGALGDPGTDQTRHLASRHEVGRILASGPTPVTEIRAGGIVGSGSLSFELVRHLTETLPIALTPRWTRSSCQPVAVRDVLASLIESLGHDGSRIIDLGGPDILTYEDMMKIYAEESGLGRRRIVRLPLMAPRASSFWGGIVTPLPTRVVRRLIESLRGEMIVRGPDRWIGDTTYRAAVRHALTRLPGGVTTRWSDAGSRPPGLADPTAIGGPTYLDRQIIPTEAATDHLFWAFSRIGGSTGYYWLDWAWRIRGFLDQLFGGVGLRRGRRHPTDVRPGESIDFWRVESVEPGRRMRLRAELKLPGEAWVEWEARPTEYGSDLVQTAWFRPRGLWGRLYWYTMLPAHKAVFPNMACRIAATAEERDYACS